VGERCHSRVPFRTRETRLRSDRASAPACGLEKTIDTSLILMPNELTPISSVLASIFDGRRLGAACCFCIKRIKHGASSASNTAHHHAAMSCKSILAISTLSANLQYNAAWYRSHYPGTLCGDCNSPERMQLKLIGATGQVGAVGKSREAPPRAREDCAQRRLQLPLADLGMQFRLANLCVSITDVTVTLHTHSSSCRQTTLPLQT